MKRIAMIALAALAVLAMWPEWSHAEGPKLKVTPYEAGLDGGTKVAAPGSGGGGLDGGTILAPKASTETGLAPKVAETPEAAAPEPQFQYVIAAIVTVADKPVWFGVLQSLGPFDDKAECDAALDDPRVKKANDGLSESVKVRIDPDAKVGVSCKAIPTE